MQTIKTQPIPQETVPCLTALDVFARRALDILFSAVGLIVLAPVFAFISVAIKRDSPGPVLYRGPRLGRDGRMFHILKFRTMYEAPESYQGPRVTASGDTRITPLGRWLRDTKFNELPQLWNVLVGEMSLVGPRPEDPEIAREWPAKVGEVLLSVRPGVTSPATVLFRTEEQMLQSSTLMDDYLRTILPDKMRLDMIYVRNRNVLTDIDVIFMTLVMLLPRLRKNQVPETMLYWGPLAQFISRYLNWFAIDTLVAFCAIATAGVLWRIDAPLNLGLNLSLAISVLVSLCFSVTNSLLGLNQIQWRRAPANEVIPLAFSTGVATAVLVLLDLFVFRGRSFPFSDSRLPPAMLIIAGIFSFIGFVALRYRERLVTGLADHWLRLRSLNSAVGERVVIIGAGNNSQFATWLFTHSDFARAFSVIGIVDDDPRKQGMFFDGYRVIGTTRDISDLAARLDVGLLVFTIGNCEDAERQRILKACRSTRAKVAVLPDIMAELRGYFVGNEKAVKQPRYMTDLLDPRA